MKKPDLIGHNVITGYIFLLISIFNVGAARAQPQQIPPKPQGLITRLISIKYNTELYLSTTLKQASHKLAESKTLASIDYEKNTNNANIRTKIDSALAIYNTIRWKVDALVYELSGDMVAANSPRKIRLLNEWCLQQPSELALVKKSSIKKSIQIFTQSLTEIDNYYQEKIAVPMYVPTKTLNLTTNVFYLLKDSYTIIKGLSDIKTQKTMALIELLDHTRLLSPIEIEKQVK